MTISNSKTKTLYERMARYNIQESDILEKFIRGSGKGGQKINKTSSCVWLRHVPTGIEVKCQKERSQVMNRFFARRLLVDKIVGQIEGEKSDEQQRREKIRRQKRRRNKRAKEKMLANKKHQGEKKKLRGSIRMNHE